MALQSVTGAFYPDFPNLNVTMGAAASSSLLLDAAGEKVAFIFRAPKTGTLSAVTFLTGTVTTGQTMKVSFQDVSAADGNPDGVVDQFRTVSIADTDDDVAKTTGIISSDGTDGGTKRSVTKGDLLAVVVEFDSTPGNLNLKLWRTVSTQQYDLHQCYVRHFTASWASAGGLLPAFAVQYDDSSYGYIAGSMPAVTVGDASAFLVNTGSNPDEISLLFSLPFPCKADGVRCSLDADGDADVVLYDSDGSTVLASVTLDKDIRASTSADVCVVPFSAEVSLAKDTNYRLAIKPTTTTNVGIPRITFFSNAAMAQAGGGVNINWSQRVDAGSWSNNNTIRPCISLRISALDDGVGGGGGLLVHPGMAGGMRG